MPFRRDGRGILTRGITASPVGAGTSYAGIRSKKPLGNLTERIPITRHLACSYHLRPEGLNNYKESCMTFPVVYLARHGETAWTVTGQHTGRTDLPLTEGGERNARRLAERLNGVAFAKVLTSPLRRAVQTCELAGFGPVAETDPDLVEWDYGDYEGRRTVDILRERPDWQLFRDGCPDGESPQQVAARADRVVSRVRAVAGNVLLFSSGHFLRVLATRWIGIEPIHGRSLMLDTASLSALSYENTLSRPAIWLWNDTHHVLTSNGQKSLADRASRLQPTR